MLLISRTYPDKCYIIMFYEILLKYLPIKYFQTHIIRIFLQPVFFIMIIQINISI